MKMETLKKNTVRNVTFAVGALAILIGGIAVGSTRAKYQHTQDMRLVNGSVTYKLGDVNIMGIYQVDLTSESGYKEISNMPTSGYKISENKSYCEVNGVKDDNAILYTNEEGEHIFANLQKKSKCWLYFDNGKTMDIILAGYNTSTRSDFSVVYTEATTKTVFTAEDGLGTSKYFAGAPTDNYVKFGGFYWRIIRMNGDKSTRLIYAGKASVIDGLSNKQTVLANGYNDNSTKYTNALSNKKFNATKDDNAYVGFKYTTGSLRGISEKSTVLGELDIWYEGNLKTNYGKYIDGSTGFCGDRTPSTSSTTSNGSGGTGTTTTYYGDYIRLKTNKNPVLTCANSSDLYTISESSRGNTSLTNPIGLINANEVAMAGGVYNVDNTNYYLYTNNYYWTMSPCYFSGSVACMCSVWTTGYLGFDNVLVTLGVRPVINLASSTRFLGSGTWDDPFIVVN